MADAAVVITTHNRRDDLARAVQSALDQRGADVEVIVIDDGSTDGTSEMIRTKFPQVMLHRHEISTGYIVGRNFAATLTTAPIIFSIDDDAAFVSPHTVAQTLAEFNTPRIGAVAIPFADVNRSSAVKQRAPGEGVWVTHTFIGTAHALRRQLFLDLGGYREMLYHQGEEIDYCLRMLDVGYFVRLGNADPIEHYESPRRDITRMSLFGRRNDVLFAWHNAPSPLRYMLGTTVKGLLHGVKVGRPLLMLQGLLRGLAACGETNRKPVRSKTWATHRQLKRRGPTQL